jgi:hypothetical protein
MTTETIEAPARTAEPETVELPLEAPPKPLKLSEAMRLGSIATTSTESGWTDKNGGMCAMSTAWYALTGGDDNNANGSPLVHLLEEAIVPHPITGNPSNLTAIIINLHDARKWSRTQTADWLESIGL